MDYDEIEQFQKLTPARVLRAIAVLRAQMEAPGATSGIIAERPKQGLATRGEGDQGDGGQIQRLTWLLGMCRYLTPREVAVGRARYNTPDGSVGYERLSRRQPQVRFRWQPRTAGRVAPGPSIQQTDA